MNPLGHAFNNYPATINRFLGVKIFGRNVRLQRTPTCSEQFLLQILLVFDWRQIMVDKIHYQVSIPVGCVPHACQLYGGVRYSSHARPRWTNRRVKNYLNYSISFAGGNKLRQAYYTNYNEYLIDAKLWRTKFVFNKLGHAYHFSYEHEISRFLCIKITDR